METMSDLQKTQDIYIYTYILYYITFHYIMSYTICYIWLWE